MIYSISIKKYTSIIDFSYLGYDTKVQFLIRAPHEIKNNLRAHLSSLQEINTIFGITNGFDFLAETQKRAPAWVRKTGFEWLWRLIRHPNRIGRIFNAVVVFPLKVIFSSSQEQ